MKETTHELALEGKTFVVQKRESDDPLTGKVTVYSMDNGKTWQGSMHLAYLTAKEADSLTEIGQPLTEGGEAEAFFLALIQESAALKTGERLLLSRTDTQVVVLKESVVLAVRASTITDIDFKLQEGS